MNINAKDLLDPDRLNVETAAESVRREQREWSRAT